MVSMPPGGSKRAAITLAMALSQATELHSSSSGAGHSLISYGNFSFSLCYHIDQVLCLELCKAYTDLIMYSSSSQNLWYLISIEQLVLARQCSKYITCIASFNPHNTL